MLEHGLACIRPAGLVRSGVPALDCLQCEQLGTASSMTTSSSWLLALHLSYDQEDLELYMAPQVPNFALPPQTCKGSMDDKKAALAASSATLTVTIYIYIFSSFHLFVVCLLHVKCITHHNSQWQVLASVWHGQISLSQGTHVSYIYIHHIIYIYIRVYSVEVYVHVQVHVITRICI